MYCHILIATDGSELAGRAVEHGVAVAKATGAKVTAVTVTERFPTSSGVMMPSAGDVRRYEVAMAQGAQGILAKVEAAARAAGVAFAGLHIPDVYPADGIMMACQDRGCDLIVMATHGRRGMDRFLMGSQATKVMTASKVPVLICR